MKAESVLRMKHRGSVHQADQIEQSFSINEIVVGKDVLELVSSAMYVDPMTVYREYIQNAADAIDEARALKLLSADEAGHVSVDVDVAGRAVRIRDNGCGIAWPDFVRRMTAIGGSAKRGSSSRGFRGVGRLAGLGYAQEVVFRSRVLGEDRVSELHWDCRKLRAKLRAAEAEDGIAETIRSVVSARQIVSDGYPQRFLEVEMKGVVRLRNDRLLNAQAIADYIGQIGPVPFSPDFRYGPEIVAALSPFVKLGELEVQVSGVEGLVYRPHRNFYAMDEKKVNNLSAIEFVEIAGLDGSVAGIAWVLHHDYEGAVPTGTGIKGLRLRSGNIQVGDHSLLEDLFPEPRFNVWSVGEVHVVDKRIVANGRRDHFEQSSHYLNLVNHLSPLARDISRRCRTNSARRKWLRDFELLRQSVLEKLGVLEQGSVGKVEANSIALSIEQSLLQMEKVAGLDLLVEDCPDELRKIVVDLRDMLQRMMRDGLSEDTPLARLSADKRAMYEHLFELVYSCSTNRSAAKALIDRILLKIS
ncbi:hypothetical protein BK022_19830 [Methylorubrum extorquens]|uniref:Molecular chaperone Hsp90 n=1 Tax=Methylorubrum extorquens TaxID=408 RepID=A0A1S1P0Z1_METEX|nr:hypothetical protein BK022_19830 [Methylorubrum extorquens]